MNRAVQHPVFSWSVAWGITGIALQFSGTTSNVERMPVWLAVVAGGSAWAIAGATTTRHVLRQCTGRVTTALAAGSWAGAYILSFSLAAILGRWFGGLRFGPLLGPGFIGVLLGCAAGPPAGVLMTLWIAQTRHGASETIRIPAVWGISFFLAGYMGIEAGFILRELAKAVLGSTIGLYASLALGWGMGWALAAIPATVFSVGIWTANVKEA